ncbi:BgiBFREP26.1 [Biomphalaria glabrata]|nr:BgiBFREP26.1 [Biomphalaria glabrata]
MAFFLRLALWTSLVFLSASELVIDVQPNAIIPEITAQLVINCSITNNEVQDIEVIKSLTLSRYNETIKEFDDLFVLNSPTLDLKQLQQFTFSQVSFGNLFITLSLYNLIQFDTKVYRCNARGDDSNGTIISKFAKKVVDWEKNSTVFIEEIRRLKKNEDNCQCSVKKDKRTDIDQSSKVSFYGSSEIVQELIQPLTLNCLFKFINYDQNEDYTLQSLYLLHESNGVIAYINKNQTVTAIQEIASKNVTGEIYDNKLRDSYLQVKWKNLKISDSGKYFCEAHIQYLEGRSEKFNEMLTITVQSPTLDDLVNVIQKLITQVKEDKESLQASKTNIENLKKDLNENIKRIREEVNTNKQNITSFRKEINTNKLNIKSIGVNIDRNITMLREDIFTNKRIIKGINEEMDTNTRSIENMRMEIDRNNLMLNDKIDSNTRNIENLIVDMDKSNAHIKYKIDANTQSIYTTRLDMDTNITSFKTIVDRNTHTIKNMKVDTDTHISLLKIHMDTNTETIKILRVAMDANITKLKEGLNTNKQMINNVQENHEIMVANFSSDLEELKKQILEVKSHIKHTSCRNVNYNEARVIVTLASGLKVMCDTKTDGGGWIIFQRRINGNVDFYRGWKEYRDGFGDYNIGEFYLGNENMFKLTSTGQYDLRIDLEFNDKTYFAQYEDFKVLSETEKYKLEIGNYSGNASNGLRFDNNMFFSTFDRENDLSGLHCAQLYSGAWWYNDCSVSNLNGKWGSKSDEGLRWHSLTGTKNSVSFSEMKLRERM